MKLSAHLLFMSSVVLLGFGSMPCGAATILVQENFGGSGSQDLAGTTADVFHADLTSSGGSSNWSGDGNIKADGGANGNHAKVIYLSLGSYINDSKGNADAVYELTVTSIANPDTTNQGGIGFLAFSNTDSPGSGSTTHTIASIGSNYAGTTVGYGFGDIDLNGMTTGSSGNPHTVTITLDLSSSYYNGSTQFGRITLTDSVEGTLAFTDLTSDQDFASISFVLDGLKTGNRARVEYSALTLSQIPEPSAVLLGGFGALLLLRRRRR